MATIADIAKACKSNNIDYVVRMNSGVIYFTKSSTTLSVSNEIQILLKNGIDSSSSLHRSNANEYADEPIIGIAMGKLGLPPLPTENSNLLMAMPLMQKNGAD